MIGGWSQRGQSWVANAASGVEVVQRQDPNNGRWRLLLRFGNGAEETVTVTRVEGRLLFEEL